MKRFLILSLLFVTTCFAARMAHLEWQWDMTTVYAKEPGNVFVIRSSPSLLVPVKDWPVRAIVPGDVRRYDFLMDQPQQFFHVQSSNTVYHWSSPLP